MDIKTVVVLGANGSMGRNISAIFASFGDAKVYMVARKLENAVSAKELAIKSVRADSIEKKLFPVTYDQIEKIVREADLIFESVGENFETKQKVLSLIKPFLSQNKIVASGTSGLSINSLANILGEEFASNFYGIHFYNPPYIMTLCELIPYKNANTEKIRLIKKYLSNILQRDVVVIQDKPAFIGNRIGFQFINQALQFAELHAKDGGIDYVDYILGGHSGRAMSPLMTSDFVGLDVHKAIVENLYNNTKDYLNNTFELPTYAQKLIDQNMLGRKTKKGLYKREKNEDGRSISYVYDIEKGTYRKLNTYSIDFIEQMKKLIHRGEYFQASNLLLSTKTKESKILLHFMLIYVVYGIYISNSIGEDIHSSDTVMATGYNWIPPLAFIDFLGGKEVFIASVKANLNSEFLSFVKFDQLTNKILVSNYDFRRFLIA